MAKIKKATNNNYPKNFTFTQRKLLVESLKDQLDVYKNNLKKTKFSIKDDKDIETLMRKMKEIILLSQS
jgi:hypothetical protein